MTHQPTIKQMRYLCALSEHLHFGNAAEACNISQSTLSAGIKELEESLEVTLVERSNKKVLITAVGHEIIARSQHILTEISDMKASADASRRPFSAEMRLGVIPTIAPYLLPEILKITRHQYPDFKLFIREDLSAQLVKALEKGELDILLLALPYPADNTETQHLFNDKLFLACHSGHSLLKKKHLDLRALKGRELLLLEDGHCLRDHALETCKLSESDVQMPFQGTSLNTIVQMTANKIGITLVPAMAIDSLLLQGTDIQIRSLNDDSVSRSIALMWRKNSPRREEFELLGELIKTFHDSH